jgi:uncharacterized membrane protein
VESWPDLLHLVGILVEFVGVLLTFNSFTTTIYRYQIPIALASALVRGKMARAASFLWNKEKAISTLQGIALIVLGFILQMTGIAIGIAKEPSTSYANSRPLDYSRPVIIIVDPYRDTVPRTRLMPPSRYDDLPW